MNNTFNENEWLLRALAIIGFIITVCLLAWLAVQLVRFMPTVFSSLANVFESNQRELDERTDDNGNVIVVRGDSEDESEEGTSEDETTVTAPEEEEPVIATTTPPVTTNPNPTPAPAPVQYKTVKTYKVPVSDPNGFADMQVAFVAVGRVTSEGRFVPTNGLEEGEVGALQFTVKNVGTKTSGEWHFKAELPGSNSMNSKVQKPLKPSETSTLTVVFTPESRGNRSATVTVTGGNDDNLSNNSFTKSVEVAR